MRSRAPALAAALVAILAAAVSCDSSPIPEHRVWIRVAAAVDEIEIGRPFPLIVETVHEKGLVPEVWSDDVLAPLYVELLETLVREDDRRVMETRRYRAVVVTLDDVLVPAIRISARPPGGGDAVTATAEPIEIRVKRSLDPAAPGPAELPGGLRTGGSPLPLAIGLAALLVAGALLVSVRRRRNAAAEVAPLRALEPPPGAADRALTRLRRLREKEVHGAEAIRGFYDEGSAIVRDYVSEQFGTRTRERTTEEILADRPAEGEHEADLARVLGDADLVKFAKSLPGPDDREAFLETAERLVRGTGESGTGPAPGGNPS